MLNAIMPFGLGFIAGFLVAANNARLAKSAKSAATEARDKAADKFDDLKHS